MRKSPCARCVYVQQSKNSTPCSDCIDPQEFADAVREDCVVQAVDYREPFAVAESYLKSFVGVEITIS